jgi:soluble lytic murein transglycosylase
MKRRLKIGIYTSAVFCLILTGLIIAPRYYGDILYPLEYKSLVKKYCDEFNVNPNFAVAVIFTESRFTPTATSRVGARGLMQVMPGTAQGIANALNDKDFTVDKLYDPETSIRYGIYYLHNLLDRYDHSEKLATMGYNGGGGAVMSYQAGRGLPVETQGYVAKVAATKNMYDQIYGQWWLNADFQKPQNNQTFALTITNIWQFWRVLISGGEAA